MEKTINDEILELDRQLCFRLYRVSRNMTKVYEPYLKEYGITYPQYIVMLVLFQEKEIEFSQLSERVDLTKATLSPIINRLETMAYLEKKHVQGDKRRIIITMTSKGESLKEKIVSVPIRMYGALGIDRDSYFTLVKELDALQEILKTKINEKEI